MSRNNSRLPAAAFLAPLPPTGRLTALAAYSREAALCAEALCGLAIAALAKLSLGDGSFLTAIEEGGDGGVSLQPTAGDDCRAAASVALGLAGQPLAVQRGALHGGTAVGLALFALQQVRGRTEDAALAAWAGAEVAGVIGTALFARLGRALDSGHPIETAAIAQMLLAALAAGERPEAVALGAMARDRLLAGLAPSGLFPHRLPADAPSAGGEAGSLADQAFAILALSRLAARRDRPALAAAAAAASRLRALQGLAGQWWAVYAPEHGLTATPYPVRTAHQHGLVPMALMALAEAGGPAHWPAIVRGLRWIDRHPEAGAPLVSQRHPFIWRQVERGADPRAPARLARQCLAADLGWMLLAWRPAGAVSLRRRNGRTSHGRQDAAR